MLAYIRWLFRKRQPKTWPLPPHRQVAKDAGEWLIRLGRSLGGTGLNYVHFELCPKHQEHYNPQTGCWRCRRG